MLARFDNTTVTLHTGEVVSLQQYTNSCSIYLIKKLVNFKDKYSNALRKTLANNYDRKWSVVRKALDKMHDKFKDCEDRAEYDVSMEMAICDILYPEIDQKEQFV